MSEENGLCDKCGHAMNLGKAVDLIEGVQKLHRKELAQERERSKRLVEALKKMECNHSHACSCASDHEDIAKEALRGYEK